MELGKAEKALGRIHDAVVVHHGEHEAAGVGVTIYQRKGWHGESKRANTYQHGECPQRERERGSANVTGQCSQ